MMSSQKDIFQDCESVPYRKPRISSYDPGAKKYEYIYSNVVLFSWDVDLASPFSLHKVSSFKETDIKPEWLSKNLGVNCRLAKLRRLSPFPGQVFSLIAKIELGNIFDIDCLCTYPNFFYLTHSLGAGDIQMDGLIKHLNMMYAKYSETSTSVTECLKKIVDKTPYR